MVDESIDSLYARWQANPDAAHTAALCEALRGGLRPDLIEIVGRYAARQLDVGALLAAARMYADADRLDDAQSVLVAAGRLAPREGEVYRWLGEVLLRRGDVERAERVLEKAVQFGSAAAGPLLQAARAPAQRAPAEEAMARSAYGEQREPRVVRQASARIVPAESDDDIDTQIRTNEDVRTALEAALAPLSAPARGSTPMRGIGPDLRPRPQTHANPFPSAHSSALGGDRHVASGAAFANEPRAQAATAAFGSPGLPAHVAVGAADAGRGIGQPPAGAPLLEASSRPVGEGAPVPDAREVLEALEIAGVYEPTGHVGPPADAWAKPERGPRRLFGVAMLVGLAVLLVGGGFGTYEYVKSVRERQKGEAEVLVSSVEANLRAGDPSLLGPSEEALAKAFELDSRSREAALAWVRERALKGLLDSGEDISFEDGTQRAKAVGVDEKWVAFAYVASFLFQGDTAGAASTIAKWDTAATEDPWFHLLAGATFERAGDPRSLERYAKALELDPDLVVAQVLLARAMAVEGDPGRAAELAKDFQARHPERPEGAALAVLAWALDPLRAEPPAEVTKVSEHGERFPAPLRSVAHAARAIASLSAGATDEAKPALKKALAVADTPGIAAWLGSLALTTGDEALARRAALTAVSFSAVYPPARVLAARVALLGGRLDEALKAVEELEPSSVDVAVVTAAVAYEKLDGEHMARALEAVPDEARKHPTAAPLVRGEELLRGELRRLGRDAALRMAKDDAPWSDLVAIDWALDAGELELARSIADAWRGPPRAVRAVRLARLARYAGELDDADTHSRAALEGGSVTVRALAERVFTLVARERTADALALFKTHPNVGGPLAKWLRAYALAAHGRVDEARAIVSQEEPPPALAPMPARVVAASAFAMLKDKRRGTDYTRAIVQAGFASPDVAFASEQLGAGKPPARRGR